MIGGFFYFELVLSHMWWTFWYNVLMIRVVLVSKI